MWRYSEKKNASKASSTDGLGSLKSAGCIFLGWLKKKIKKKKDRKLHIWPNNIMKSFFYRKTSVLINAIIRLRDVLQHQPNVNKSFTVT